MYSLGTFSFGTRPTEARSTTWAEWGVGAWAENLSTRLAVLRRGALPRLIATWRNTKTLTQSSSTSAVLTGMTFPIGGWIYETFIRKTLIGTWFNISKLKVIHSKMCQPLRCVDECHVQWHVSFKCQWGKNVRMLPKQGSSHRSSILNQNTYKNSWHYLENNRHMY